MFIQDRYWLKMKNASKKFDADVLRHKIIEVICIRPLLPHAIIREKVGLLTPSINERAYKFRSHCVMNHDY
jgi:hypothetical protein